MQEKINPIPHDILERRCYMTLGQYDPELTFGFTSQQMAMLASKLVSDKILDILTSIYINISTFKGVCPSIHVLQTWSMSAYWDFENRKSTKGSPLWDEKKNFVSDFTQILCVRPFDHKDFKFWLFFQKKIFKIFPFFPNARGPPKNFNVQNFKGFEKNFPK